VTVVVTSVVAVVVVVVGSAPGLQAAAIIRIARADRKVCRKRMFYLLEKV